MNFKHTRIRHLKSCRQYFARQFLVPSAILAMDFERIICLKIYSQTLFDGNFVKKYSYFNYNFMENPIDDEICPLQIRWYIFKKLFVIHLLKILTYFQQYLLQTNMINEMILFLFLIILV